MYSTCHISFDNIPEWFTYLRKPLGLTAVGLNLVRVPAGKGYTFMHRHERQEEVYIILRGSGLIHIESEDILLSEGDIVRVAPEALRAVKASDDTDLIILCAGADESDYSAAPDSDHLMEDGVPDWENLPPWYEGNEKIRKLNERIRASRKQT